MNDLRKQERKYDSLNTILLMSIGEKLKKIFRSWINYVLLLYTNTTT